MQEEIEYAFFLKPNADLVLGQYVLEFVGKAICWDSGEEKTVGEMMGYRIDFASAGHDGHDQSLLLDSVVPDISDFAEIVLHNDACILQSSPTEQIEEIECDCLVFIAELKVKKLYRGQGIGSALLRRMGSMIDLSNCLIGLKAFPLTDDYGKAAKAEEIAQVKHFYELHNFTHAGGEFMVKDARLCDVMKKKLAHRRAK